MKKGKGFLLFLIGTLLGACLAVGVYFLTVGEVAWQEYLETKLVPNAVLAFTTISGLLVVATPVVNKIQLAVLKFNQATKDVNDTVETGKDTQERLKAQDDLIKGYETRFDKMETLINEKFDNLQTTATNTEQIVRIGLGNTQELVANGYATEIAKVGHKDEET